MSGKPPPLLMRLGEAAKVVFGDGPGAPSVRKLREAAVGGRLEAWEFAGKWFTTPEHIMAMVCKRRVVPQPSTQIVLNNAPRATAAACEAAARAQAAFDALRNG